MLTPPKYDVSGSVPTMINRFMRFSYYMRIDPAVLKNRTIMLTNLRQSYEKTREEQKKRFSFHFRVTNFAGPKMKSRITNSPRQAEGLVN
jgi:hypothetical protein